MTVSSNYHIEVNPSDVGMYDRVVVMDLVKTTAQTHQIDPSGQREFKGTAGSKFKNHILRIFHFKIKNNHIFIHIIDIFLL